MDQERMDRIIRAQRILERVEGYAATLEEIAQEELDDALFYEDLLQGQSQLTLQMRELSVALTVGGNTLKKKCVSLKKTIEKNLDAEEPLPLEHTEAEKPSRHLLTHSEIVKKIPAKKDSPIFGKGDRMSGQEIARRYRTSADKKKQLKILAELNDCTKADIVAVLRSEGIAV